MAKGSGGLTAERLRDLARSGAETMLKQFRAEIIAIERTFPELALPQKRRAVREAFQIGAPPCSDDDRGRAQGGLRAHEEIPGPNDGKPKLR